MSLYRDQSDAAFHAAQRAYDNHDDDAPDISHFLRDKPKGFCPWCDSALFTDEEPTTCLGCLDYHDSESEEENRTRYAYERLDEAKKMARIEREASRRGVDL